MKKKRLAKRAAAAALSVAVAASLMPFDMLKTQAREEKAGDHALEIWFDEPTSEGTLTPGMAGAFGTTEEDNIWQQLTLPIGNGSIGANIYGDVKEERLTFNEKTLWNGGPSTSRPGYNGGNIETSNGVAMSDIFKQIQQCYREGKDDEASNLANRLVGSSDGYGAYQSWGDIYLDFGFKDGDHTSYERALDLKNAVSTVDFEKDGTEYHREYFVSYPDQVMAMKLTAKGDDKMNVNISFPVDNAEGVTDRNLGKDAEVLAKDNQLTVSGQMQDNQMLFNGQLVVADTKGGTVEPGEDKESLDVKGAEEIVIYVAADTNYDDVYPDYRTDDTEETLDARVKGYVDNAVEKGYDNVKETHEADYKEIFDRVSLDLGQGTNIPDQPTDELLSDYKADAAKAEDARALETLLFQYGRYLTIASSRDGDLPSNLQGIWQNRVGDANRVPWGSDYHMNVNLQMNYWPTYSTNMIECATPLIDYINALKEPGEVTAQTYFGVEEGQGFTAHTQNTPFGWTCPGWSFSWGWSPAALPWILQNCYEYYEYSGDEEYLRENIYPLLKESALLYDNILMEKDGRLVSAPAYSPEHGPITAGNTYEQSLIWQLYEDTIHSAEVLGVDADKVAEWKETQSKLKPIEIGDSGQIKEWYTETTLGSIGERGHRHMSHLLGLFPGDLISVDNAEYMDAAIVSLKDRGYESTGWGIGQRINAWARTGLGDDAYRCIQSLFKNGIYPNLWDGHAPYQIDGNFGYTSGVAEMLMQSNMGYINILPSLPKQWADGHVSGLVARGNFEVDIDWENMTPYQVEITSRNGGEAVVQADGLSLATVTDEDGNPVSYQAVSEDRISFDTEKGKTYRITNIPGEETALEAVENVKAARTGADEVEVSWDALDDADVSYTVYRQINDGDVQVIAKDIKATSFTDKAAEEVLGTLKYQVQAVKTTEEDVMSGEISAQVLVREVIHQNGLIDDRNSAIAYEGGFGQYGESGLHDGTSTFIEQPTGGETIAMTFEGTGIDVYATAGPDRGMMDVYIDGEKHGIADSYRSSKQNFSKIYEVSGLTEGIHTIALELTNTKNDQSSKTKIEFDAFDVENENAVVNKVTVSGKGGVTTLAVPNSTWQMTADVDTKNADKDVTWSVDNEELATIDENGLLTIKDKPGVVTVSAVSALDEEVKGSVEMVLDIPTDDVILDNGTITECNIPGSQNNGGGTLNTDNMTWNGSGWSTWGGEAGHLRDDKVDGTQEGDSMTFTFTGVKLEIYGAMNSTFSKFGVSIDGQEYEDVDVSTKQDEKNTLLASYDGLTNDEHTVTITVKSLDGKTKIALDYFKVYKPLQSGADVTTIVEDSVDGQKNPEIEYTGSWSPWSGGENHHGGYKTESSTAGDSVTYRFYGTAIDVYAPTNPSTSGVFVTLDGEEKEPVLTYCTEEEKEYQKHIVTYDGLDADKEHVLTLTVAAPGEIEGSAAATRANFGLDYFVVHSAGEVVFSGIDKQTLQSAIAENLDKYPEQYEEAGYGVFEDAMKTAVDVMNNASVLQEDADKAAEELRETAGMLVSVETPKPDVSDMGLYVSGLESKTLVLIWNAVDDAVSYEILQGDEVIGTTDDTYFRVSELDPDTEYQFTVNAVNRAGEKAGESVVARTETSVEESTPEQVKDLAFDKESKTVTWSASSTEGIVSYTVWVNAKKAAQIPADQTLAYTMTDLIDNTVYTVSVAAVDQDGNTSIPLSITFRYEDETKPAEEISTAVLEYAIQLAKEADTEGVMTEVLEKFDAALKHAEDILSKVQAGDPSVTQEMVDESWQNLINIMQYFSFKEADKTDLEKVIAAAESLDLTKYLEEGQKEFLASLETAKEVYDDAGATQEEVTTAWKELLLAMSNLRLKPDKSALEALIHQAEGLNLEGCEKADIQMFEAALAKAQSVYENEEATQEEVTKAEDELTLAIGKVLASAAGAEDKKDQETNDGSNTSAGQEKSGADTNNVKAANHADNSAAKRSVKTGDAANVIGLAALAAASAAVAAFARRKRVEK